MSAERWRKQLPRIGTPAVRMQEESANSKLAPLRYEPHKARLRPVPIPPYCSSTYASIDATCPPSCTFKGAGCFADAGFTKIAGQRMDRAAHGLPAVEIIRQEVIALDRAFGGGSIPQDGARGGRDLRLHVGGDCANATGAAMLARAAQRWRDRGGGSVWTYTHLWPIVYRHQWGPAIAVLASCERVDQFPKARAMGYAPAIVVPDFPSRRAFRLPGSSVRIIPCPAETGSVTCIECRLCLDRDLLAMNAAIGFAAHGTQATGIRHRLRVLNQGDLT